MQSVKPSNRLSALSAQSEDFGRGAHQIVVMDSLCRSWPNSVRLTDHLGNIVN